MSMIEWAENEVELACKREIDSVLERDDWCYGADYGIGCYKSALKAYKSLMEDGHSGLSFSFTRSILESLMHNRPLTPLENNPEDWEYCWKNSESKISTYQHKRRSSLFKDVTETGIEAYHDNELVCCVDINDENNIHFSNGAVRTIYGLKHPIIFPYMPPMKPAVAYIERPGDSDYLKIHKIDHCDGHVDIFPEGEEIYKYYYDTYLGTSGVKLVSDDPEEVKKFFKAREDNLFY